MTSVVYAELEESDTFLTDIGHGVWLMDNHRWALLVWERLREETGIEKFSLIHADYHWDDLNDFHGHEQEIERLQNSSVDEIEKYVAEGRWVKYDSFIAPAVIRELFDEVHFFCKQNDGDDGLGLDVGLLEKVGITQYIHESIPDLAAYPYVSPIIFDLCIDLFNHEDDQIYEGRIWGDEEIIEFLAVMAPAIRSALVVTVSLSFGYSGTEDDTRRLAELVLPIIVEIRKGSDKENGRTTR